MSWRTNERGDAFRTQRRAATEMPVERPFKLPCPKCGMVRELWVDKKDGEKLCMGCFHRKTLAELRAKQSAESQSAKLAEPQVQPDPNRERGAIGELHPGWMPAVLREEFQRSQNQE